MLRAFPAAVAVAFAVCCAVLVGFKSPGRAAEIAPPPHPKADDPLLATSAISAVLNANGGRPPASGEELWKTLTKLGKFSQLPVVFSAVRLDSGLGNPRVVITPVVSRLSDAEPNQQNLTGRIFFAANMIKDPKGGDPFVASVEFISWNTARRRFDFGVIENMGGNYTPEFKLVDGGRCFSCHKNRGPILGAIPWTGTTHLELLRTLVGSKLQLVSVVPPGAPAGARDRIDGMALAAPEAQSVDDAVRVGRQLRTYRETFRLMNRSPAGRKAFVTLLTAIVQPGELDPNDAETRRSVDVWVDDPTDSYRRFVSDWLTLLKTTNSGVLIDFSPFTKKLVQASAWGSKTLKPLPSPPPGGFRTAADAQNYQREVNNVTASNQKTLERNSENLARIVRYDNARSEGKHEMPSGAMPSNPKAFTTDLPAPPRKPSGLVNAVMLAGTIGLSIGDRHYLTRALDEAVERLKKPKLTTKMLAREVFEGPQFADVLAGGLLPERDEFKDRFVAGLDQLLKTKYLDTQGFSPDRREYAASPRHDPKAVEEVEAAVVPTSACLRCHDVRPSGKARMFESIPALAFDPFDKVSRESWLKSATNERKEAVLSRLVARLYKDADMPPQDSPENSQFRIKQAGAFDQLMNVLNAELEKIKK